LQPRRFSAQNPEPDRLPEMPKETIPKGLPTDPVHLSYRKERGKTEWGRITEGKVRSPSIIQPARKVAESDRKERQEPLGRRVTPRLAKRPREDCKPLGGGQARKRVSPSERLLRRESTTFSAGRGGIGAIVHKNPVRREK